MLDELEFGHSLGSLITLRYIDQHHVYIAQQFSSIFPDLTEDTPSTVTVIFCKGHQGSVLWFNVSNKH